MHKRRFLAATGLAGLAPTLGLAGEPAAGGGAASAAPVMLTVAGRVGRTNRGPLDPSFEPLLKKHEVSFERGFTFDAAALSRLPQATIRPTLEYDARPHRLSGPLLSSVLAAAGAELSPATRLSLRAVDGYRVDLSWAEVQAWKMMVATRLDGRPLGLGGLGPQWGVYDADRIEAFSGMTLPQRYEKCPWAMYLVLVG